jgi:protein-tyrosine phosphatase
LSQLEATWNEMSADIYWLEQVPTGRLAILGRPRAHDWLAGEIDDWSAAGITDVVSLLEEHEVLELGLQQEAALVEQAGMRFARFSIPDRGVPASPALALGLWEELAATLCGGGTVGVHCRASIGRAGLIVAGTLLRLGVPEDLAWQRTSRARGRTVPDTDEQRAWLSRMAHSLGMAPGAA